MKKFLASLLLAAILGSPAFAADQKWKVILQVTDTGSAIRFTYGTTATGPVYFGSEDACKEAIRTDVSLSAAIAALKKMAADHQATFDSVTCVLDLPAGV